MLRKTIITCNPYVIGIKFYWQILADLTYCVLPDVLMDQETRTITEFSSANTAKFNYLFGTNILIYPISIPCAFIIFLISQKDKYSTSEKTEIV